jgi:hypothetical protein
MADQRLFDPHTTAPTTCPKCGSTRPNLCAYDANHRDTPTRERPRRPRGCLAQSLYDPRTAPFPTGY